MHQPVRLMVSISAVSAQQSNSHHSSSRPTEAGAVNDMHRQASAGRDSTNRHVRSPAETDRPFSAAVPATGRQQGQNDTVGALSPARRADLRLPSPAHLMAAISARGHAAADSPADWSWHLARAYGPGQGTDSCYVYNAEPADNN